MSSSYVDKYQSITNKAYGTGPTQEPYPQDPGNEGYDEGWGDGWGEEWGNGGDPYQDGFGGEMQTQEETFNNSPLIENPEPQVDAQAQDKLRRDQERLSRVQEKAQSEYQEAQRAYEDISSGDSEDLEERQERIKNALSELDDVDEQIEKLKNLEKKFAEQTEGIQSEAEGEADIFGDMDNGLDTGDGDSAENLEENVAQMRSELEGEEKKLEGELETQQEAEEAEATEIEAHHEKLINDIKGAGDYLSGDAERYYYSGSASGKHIYAFFEDNQSEAKKFFTELENAAQSKDWGSLKSFLSSLDDGKAGYVMGLAYVILETHKPEVLPNLPDDVLSAMAETARRGNKSDRNNEGIFYLDKSAKGIYSPGDHKRRRNNKSTGVGFGTAAQVFDSYALQSKYPDVDGVGETEITEDEVPPEESPPPEDE